MERLTMRIPAEQLTGVEALVDEGHYPNKSEAVRQAIRDLLAEHRGDLPSRRAWVQADGGVVETPAAPDWQHDPLDDLEGRRVRCRTHDGADFIGEVSRAEVTVRGQRLLYIAPDSGTAIRTVDPALCRIEEVSR